MVVLVVGATGPVGLGGAICQQLRAAGKPVRALVRATADPARVAALREAGVELVPGDLKDRASLDAACQGVAAVVTTATTTLSRQEGDEIQSVDLDGQLRLIDAARAAGAPHFVYVSISGNIKVDSPLVQAKRTVEQHLQRSGLPYTILRPSFFMEVWLGPALGFDLANGQVRSYGDGQAPVSWIARDDVAAFAVAALDRPEARNATLELGGPEALSPLEVVRRFERRSSRQVAVELVPDAALQAQCAAATDPLQRSFAALMLSLAQGDAIAMGETLDAYPVPLTTIDDYLARLEADQPAAV